jgi:hypothetical protein
VLEYLEVEKCYLFSGYPMGEHADAIAQSATNAQMLENFGAHSADGWLRQCGRLPRKDDDGTGADRVETIKENIGALAWWVFDTLDTKSYLKKLPGDGKNILAQ